MVTLAERYGGHEVTPEIYEAMIEEVQAFVDRFVAEHGAVGIDRIHMLGTSGTVTTIAGVHLELRRYERRRVDGCWMGDDEVTRVVDRLLAMSYEERVANPCIGAERADLVLAGCAILDAIRRAFPVPAAAGRRPRPARGHAGADDARGRRLGRQRWQQAVTTAAAARLKVRVKTGKSRSLSSKLWLERQLNDPYVARAKREGYRSRAAYKLIEIDDKHRLLKPGARVVDLGAAPGGWSQVAAKRVGAEEGKGRVVAIDLLEMAPMAGVEFVQLDFLDPSAPDELKALLGGPADVVLSDMAANATGHRKTDHLRIMALAEAAAEFAREVLAPGGAFLCKVLQGGTEATLLAGSSAISPASSTSSRRRAGRIRRSSISWRPGFAGMRRLGHDLIRLNHCLAFSSAAPAAGP